MRLGRDLLVAVMVLGLALMACKKDEEKDEGEKKSEDKTEEKSEEKAEEKSEGASGDKIGVPACDELMDKWEKCIEKMPEATRAGQKQAIETSRKTYKQTAANAAAKATLESTCKQQLETLKTSLGSFGCEW